MSKSESGVGKVLEMFKEHSVEYVDLRFTDPARQVAAHRAACLHDRRRCLPRRHHVRRLLDRRLEGDQRVRHDPDAGSRDRGHRSVRRQAAADPVLRHHRALDRPALRARPALHRQEGRGLRRRPAASATPRSSVPRPSSSCSTASASTSARTTACYQLDHQEGPQASTEGIPGRQHGPPPDRQGRLFPGPAGRQRERPARRDALDHGRDGPDHREAPP